VAIIGAGHCSPLVSTICIFAMIKDLLKYEKKLKIEDCYSRVKKEKV
jgi:hypothetical protein